jgi:uncharacterized protein (TIGR02246 family)
MSRRILFCSVSVLALAALAFLSWRPAGQAQPPETKKGPVVIGAGAGTDLSSLKASSKAYLDAFNKGDARGAAACWATTCEYTGPDGETVKGRENIEKSYTAFFKKYPGAKAELETTSARIVAGNTALEEGIIRLSLPGKETQGTRYNAVLVREKDKWLIASVKENDIHPSELVKIADLAWLIGTWSGKNGDREVTTDYRWDENKVYIIGDIVVKQKGKTITTARMRIGKDGALGALRSWTFETTGAVGEAIWYRDGDRWVSEASANLPEGATLTATNLITPTGPDSFTFQSVGRAIDEQELPDQPPLKITRVKK